MIDVIDADMNARLGDAELTPWLLLVDCAPQHIAAEFRSTMRDTRPHIKLYVQRNFTGNTQPLDQAYMPPVAAVIRAHSRTERIEPLAGASSNEVEQRGLLAEV